MTPPEFEFELHCIKIHPINHYSVLPLSRLFWSEAKSLTRPAQAYPLLCGLPHHISFFFHSLFLGAKIGTHSPCSIWRLKLHIFVLSFSLIFILSVPRYHYGSYTLAVEKHTGRINIFFRYIFIICWSSNYLFYINSEDIFKIMTWNLWEQLLSSE